MEKIADGLTLDALAKQPFSAPKIPTPAATPSRATGLAAQFQPQQPITHTPAVAQDIAKLTAPANHPYFSNVDNPAKAVGPFTVGEGFNDSYSQWLNSLAPQQQQQFQQEATTAGMPPDVYARGLAAKQLVSPQQPGSFYSLPSDFRQAFLAAQNHDIANYVDPVQRTTPEYSAPARVGAGRSDWVFPPREDVAHVAFNPDGSPKLLSPQSYEGLEPLAERYNIDMQEPAFHQYWQSQQASGNYVPPNDMLRKYWLQREGQRAQAAGQDESVAQRVFGYRRNNPMTGKDVMTVPRAGQTPAWENPEGLYGDVKAIGSYLNPRTGLPIMASGLASDALSGEYEYTPMMGRDLMAPVNRLLGTDMGWNSAAGMAPSAFQEGGVAQSVDVGQGIPTTRGLMTAVRDPITGREVGSGMDAAAKGLHTAADSQETSMPGRILARGAANLMERGDDLLAARNFGKAVGLSTPLAGAALQGGTTAVDPNTPLTDNDPRRNAVAGTIDGFLNPFTANPLYGGISQSVREVPGYKAYQGVADDIRNPEKLRTGVGMLDNQHVRNAVGGTMEMAPELLLSHRLSKLAPTNSLKKLTEVPFSQAAGSALGQAAVGLDPSLYDRSRTPADVLRGSEAFSSGLDRTSLGLPPLPGQADLMQPLGGTLQQNFTQAQQMSPVQRRQLSQRLTTAMQPPETAMQDITTPPQVPSPTQPATAAQPPLQQPPPSGQPPQLPKPPATTAQPAAPAVPTTPPAPQGQATQGVAADRAKMQGTAAPAGGPLAATQPAAPAPTPAVAPAPAPTQSPQPMTPPQIAGRWLDAIPGMDKVQQLVQAAPEQAADFMGQIKSQVANTLKNPAAQQEVQSILTNGTLTPAGQQQAVKALADEGWSMDMITKNFSQMQPFEQFLLAAGLGVGALGLVNALGGEGGAGSLLLSLLGLGTAAFTAGRGGMLGEGAKSLTQGLTDAVPGMLPGVQPQQEQAVPEWAQALGRSANHAPDWMVRSGLQHLQATQPDLAKKLDIAAGRNTNWGEDAMGMLGDWTGYTDRELAKYGLDPAGKDRVLQMWKTL